LSKFVDVVITRQTKAISQKGFGMPLLFSGDEVAAYKEYSGDTALAEIGVDFSVESDTYKLAAKILGQTPKPEKLAVYGIVFVEGTTPIAELAAALDELILTNNDWFYLVSTFQTDASITELSTWVARQEKLYAATTSNKLLGTTLNTQNTFLQVHPDPLSYAAEAWIGVCASKVVGSFTWTFKQLANVVAAGYTPSDVALIETNKGNTYIKEGGVNITSNSLTTSGDYIDIIQSTYYLKSRMSENVFNLLVQSDKVPFTNNGIALILAAVEATLKDGFNNGIIAEDADGKPMFVINAPNREEISVNDRANRTLPGITWEATIAGAVEKVKIGGTLLV
jgi:hypothetical protein